MYVLNGGIVELNGEKTRVDRINWDGSRPEDGGVADDAVGFMFLKTVPRKRNYRKGETVIYSNSNNNNTNGLKILEYKGPIKYRVKKMR